MWSTISIKPNLKIVCYVMKVLRITDIFRLSSVRNIHQNKLTEYMKENQINYNYVRRSEEEWLKLLIDCSTNEWLPTCINHMVTIERICKNWIPCPIYIMYALHVKNFMKAHSWKLVHDFEIQRSSVSLYHYVGNVGKYHLKVIKFR